VKRSLLMEVLPRSKSIQTKLLRHPSLCTFLCALTQLTASQHTSPTNSPHSIEPHTYLQLVYLEYLPTRTVSFFTCGLLWLCLFAGMAWRFTPFRTPSLWQLVPTSANGGDACSRLEAARQMPQCRFSVDQLLWI